MENTNDNLQQKCYDWIVNAIDSSNNEFHIDCCKKLIELYSQKFEGAFKEAELLMLLHEKLHTINYSLS